MKEPIKSGDDCLVVGGVLRAKSPNVGKTVRVVSLQGEHSTLGRVWQCAGEKLVQFDGSISTFADFPVAWLQKVEGIEPKIDTKREEGLTA